MRLWSIHPKYLDAQGLVALWREGLLAKKVLEGKTRGYKNHPQLVRFKISNNPVGQINIFLKEVYNESIKRGYKFDKGKLDNSQGDLVQKIRVNRKQVEYEMYFLQSKLEKRNKQKYNENNGIKDIEINKVFTLVEGEIEEWEKVKEIGKIPNNE